MGEQLSLFAPNESGIDSSIRRAKINGKMYFSVLDVFEHYGNARNPRTSWRTALTRLESQGFQSGREILQHQFEGQGQRKTPIATFNTMLRIAQVTEFKEWEAIRQWMADLAEERIEEELHPDTIVTNARERQRATYKRHGKSDGWIEQRQKGVEGRNYIAEMEVVYHETHNPKFAALTGRTYKELFGLTKAQIVKAAEMTPNQAKHFRDNLNVLALQAINTAELTAAMQMEQMGRLLTDEEQDAIVTETARMFAPAFRTAAHRLGIHLATGKPLLTNGKK